MVVQESNCLDGTEDNRDLFFYALHHNYFPRVFVYGELVAENWSQAGEVFSSALKEETDIQREACLLFSGGSALDYYALLGKVRGERVTQRENIK